MSYVLAIEPNEGQSALLRDAVRFRAKTKIRVVDSIEAASAAIFEEIPRLVLIPALMPPREEGTLVKRLRTLPVGSAPEVLIIPRLARAEKVEKQPSLLGRFRRRGVEPSGCDPLEFADQLIMYLGRPLRGAAELHRNRRNSARTDQLDWAGASIDGLIVELVDLSTTGAQFLGTAVLPPGGTVAVQLASDADAVLCEGRVVWSGIETGAEGKPYYRAGVVFSEAYRTAIERFCIRRERILIA